MAANILQAQKRQRYLILILALLTCVMLLVVWQNFFKPPKPAVMPVSLPNIDSRAVEINWAMLQNPKLEALAAFGQIPGLQGEPGRKNPFTPY